MTRKTIVDLFETSTHTYPNNTFLLEKNGGEFIPTTYSQAKEKVYQLGAGLVALGVKPKDNLALLSEGCNLWILAELAMFYAGGVSVPLSIKLEESNDLIFRLLHSEAKAIFVSNNQLKKIRQIAAHLPSLKHIIVFDKQEMYEEKEIYIGDVNKLGADLLKENNRRNDFLAIGQSIENNDCATITYTSGTTATPKGVMLTHRNYTANVEQALSQIEITQNWRTLIILPLDHCFAHVVGFYIFLFSGATVATVEVGRNPMETLRNIPTNIKEVKPHLILSVPALAKSFKKNIETAIRSKGEFTYKLFNIGLTLSYIYNGEGFNSGQGIKKVLKPAVFLFDRLFSSKVRENFGGELKMFIGGGALLDKELQRFFYAVGMPMFQGYGLSEATPVISTNSPKNVRFGSSGKCVKPLDAKICDSDGNSLPLGEKGELVIKGENVMAGYYKNPESTAETIKDGWLHTGDMGYMDQEGFLYILGRFKSLLIGSDGEKYSPEGIEETITGNSHIIEQIMLHNNQNPFTVALITLNAETLKRELKSRGLKINTAKGQKEIVSMVEKEINRYKKGGEFAQLFPQRWLPTTFAIVPEPFTEKDGLINSTMKLVRPKVEEKYASLIDFLFTPEGKEYYNEQNFLAAGNY